MIIVCEGPDNSGKTTVGQRLAKDLGGIFLKTNVRPVTTKVLREFVRLSIEIEMSFGILVLDRHHAISEPIYGAILRGHHDLDMIECTLSVSNLHAIYCRPPDEIVHKWSESNPQLEGVKEKIDQIIKRYDQVFNRQWLFRSVRRYSWPEDRYFQLLDSIKREVQQ